MGSPHQTGIGPISAYAGRHRAKSEFISILVVLGTRPEAVKLCPLILALRKAGPFDVRVCSTGQHEQLLDPILDVFDVHPDIALRVMQPGQTLGGLTARLIASLDSCLQHEPSDLVLVQGDTTTAFCGALAAFYHQIPVGHVEAGLRTWDPRSPWPEEINRTLVTPLADLHFAPTEWARNNLLRENVPPERVHVTGNTGIDALFLVRDRVLNAVNSWKSANRSAGGLANTALAPVEATLQKIADRRMVLITGHRRENFGPGFEAICHAIRELAQRFPDVSFVYPVHLNPNVQEPVHRLLGAYPNIHLLGPLPYLPFLALMDRAHLILTDSGGVQEEAPSLGKPVLVLRSATERPEGVSAGTVRLVGTDAAAIQQETARLLTDSDAYAAMARAVNPYGDGQACKRIVAIIQERFHRNGKIA